MNRALLVGINYVNTPNELRGCINDVRHVEAMLKTKGFTCELLLEQAATTANIKAALERLVAGAAAGDVLVFHYSGHGSQLPSSVEPDGYEEIICPIDLDWERKVITDDDLRRVFNKVPSGVNTTVILDCCHSGTGLDQGTTYDHGIREVTANAVATEKRFMVPPAHVLEELKSRPVTVSWTAQRDLNSTALLIAGCRADQLSADAYINGSYQGAATFSLLYTIARRPEASYTSLITTMNQYMVANGYDQRPQLDGMPILWNRTFLEPFSVASPVPPEALPDEENPEIKTGFAALWAALIAIFKKIFGRS